MRQFCQAPEFTGASSSAVCQVAPKSSETSSFDTVRSPDQAWPRTSVSNPISTSFAGKVTNALTGIRSMISKSSFATSSPAATLWFGTRYALPVILGPSCTMSRNCIRFSHFCAVDAGQPGTTRRSGAPFMGCNASPFISNAIRMLSVIALAIGTPRDKESFPSLPERCVSDP